MLANFARALALVLRFEGGWTNNPKDPGGATMEGVTQRVYSAFLRGKGRPIGSVRYIRNADLLEIYRRQYADAVHFDELPAGVDLVTLDYGVNSGPGKAIPALQAAAGVKADGHFGMVSLAAVRARPAADIINKICDGRLSFMHRLKTWQFFGKGWASRVYQVRMMALLMARQAVNDNRPVPLKAAA